MTHIQHSVAEVHAKDLYVRANSSLKGKAPIRIAEVEDPSSTGAQMKAPMAESCPLTLCLPDAEDTQVLSNKYPGEWVFVLNKKVIAHSEHFAVACSALRKRFRGNPPMNDIVKFHFDE